MAVLLQAGLHNKYCVKKARWEEHLRTVQEEEEIITEMYREYKVNSHNSKFMQKAFSLLKAFSEYCHHRLSECLTMTCVAEGAGRQPESAGQVGGAAVPRGRVKTSQFTAAVGHINHAHPAFVTGHRPLWLQWAL